MKIELLSHKDKYDQCLRDDMNLEICEAKEDDAEALITLMKMVDESGFTGHDPGERSGNVEEQRRIIRNNNHRLFLAKSNDKCVGFVGASFVISRRMGTTANMYIGILPEYQNRGIGRLLITRIEEWCREKGIHRLGLSVIINNVKAIRLYLKCGFIIEGISRECMRINDKYIDQYIMGKLL